MARFSKRSLNMLMVITAIFILVFSLSDYWMPSAPSRIKNETVPEKVALQDPAKTIEPTVSARLKNTLNEVPENITTTPKIDIQSWQTTQGARVLWVKSPEVPMVDVRIIFDAGSARDAEDYGLAFITNSLLMEGTADLNAEALARAFESLGAQISTSSHRDMAIIELRSLSDEKYIQPAIDLMARVTAQAEFNQESFTRNIAVAQVGLARQKQSPAQQISNAASDLIFGDHPYGHNSLGSEKTLQSLTRDDVVKFHKDYYTAKNAVIAIVGDLTKESATSIAEKLMQDLPVGTVLPEMTPIVNSAKPGKNHVEFASDQAHVRVGGLAVDRRNPDYFAFYLGNYMLGGSGLTSLLNQAIREERGLAYSAGSSLSPMAAANTFWMYLQTQNQQVDEALTVVQDIYTNWLEKGPTAEEVEKAKRELMNSMPLNISTNSSLLDHVSMLGFYDLPLNYLEEFQTKLKTVKAEDIRNAFAKHLPLDELIILSLGPKSDGSKAEAKNTEIPVKASEAAVPATPVDP
ncbi:MAG: pitrilysin family protein [Pseudomonadota bacterium]